MAYQPPTHLDITVTLVGIDPPVWRRLHVPLALSFARLHGVLQAAFGWTDSHLHEFILGGLSVGNPMHDDGGMLERQTLDATQIMLKDLLLRHFEPLTFDYLYDFGDSWLHRIVVHGSLSSQLVAPVCIEGERSGPPEDAGGATGYEELVVALKDPTHPEHKAMRRWAGRGFDPERFDLEKTNRAIRAAARGPLKGGYLVQ